MIAYLYRFIEYPDEDGSAIVYLNKHEIIKRTAKGAWIYKAEWPFKASPKKFVLLSARKQWACPTVGAARESFFARKRVQISLLTGTLRRAEASVRILQAAKLSDLVSGRIFREEGGLPPLF